MLAKHHCDIVCCTGGPGVDNNGDIGDIPGAGASEDDTNGDIAGLGAGGPEDDANGDIGLPPHGRLVGTS